MVNQSAKKMQINFKKQKDGSFLADKVTANGTIGFGFNGFDRLDLAPNKNGVYSVTQKVNGKVYSEYNFDTFSFGETRYINTFIDYEHYGKHRQRIQKCFKDNSNKLNIYKSLYSDGKIPVVENVDYSVELLISDIKGNTTKVIIPVEGKSTPLKIKKEEEKTDHYIIANKPNSFNLGAAKVYFPENTFYKNFYMDLKKGADTVKIHNNTTPAHLNFTITFDVSKYSKEEQKQLFIARLGRNLKPIHYKTYKRNNTFSARSRTFGTFTLAKDTIAPTIKPSNFKEKQYLSNYKYISLTIADDLSGINTYSATLNGEWILMEYETKKNTITYNFDDKIKGKRECDLKVVVTDNVGNSKTFKSSFFIK